MFDLYYTRVHSQYKFLHVKTANSSTRFFNDYANSCRAGSGSLAGSS